MKGTQKKKYANTNPLEFSFLSKRETDLGIGAAMGKALADPFSFWFFLQESPPSRVCRSAAAAVLPQARQRTSCGPAQTIRHPPVQPTSSLGPTQRPIRTPAQFRLKKKASSTLFSPVCLNEEGTRWKTKKNSRTEAAKSLPTQTDSHLTVLPPTQPNQKIQQRIRVINTLQDSPRP